MSTAVSGPTKTEVSAVAPVPVALQLANFASRLSLEDVPQHVRSRAKHAILDSVGVGLAASRTGFAADAAESLTFLSSSGDQPVIGMPVRLPIRDAAFLNGILVHGLDFDDTHLESAVHVSASLVPTLLAVAHRFPCSGKTMLEAYIAGLESIARIGMFGGIHLRETGFHTTSIIGIFGCTIAAGKMLGLSPRGLAMAQAIALSMCSGRIGSAADGASNKRLHPGWAAQSALTAVALARSGVVGPDHPYEGEQGLYRSMGGTMLERYKGLSRKLLDLGTVWESGKMSIKPIPACHLTHACADAAIALNRGPGFHADDIVKVTAIVPTAIIPIVCEPIDLKRRPVNAYAAQFSIPYIVAACLVRGCFTFSELDERSICDPQILKLADKVNYRVDMETTYPVHRTGELEIEFKDGSTVRHREAINRGSPDRPLSPDEIQDKFRANAGLRLFPVAASRILAATLDMESAADGKSLVEILCGCGE